VEVALDRLVEASLISKCRTVATREATKKEICLVHEEGYVEAVFDTLHEYVAGFNFYFLKKIPG
jgi:acetoin utilization deacetylase AcuC-like enzyme